MARHAAIGINDDLATGQASIGVRTTQLKGSSWVDENLQVIRHKCGGDQGVDDVFNEVWFDQCLGIEAWLVLSRYEHRTKGNRLAIFVIKGHLSLAVWTQVWKHARLANLRKAVRQTMRKPDRNWHEVFGFVTSETKHHSLVARTLFVKSIFTAGT